MIPYLWPCTRPQGKLPMAQFWGMGTTASSDGQFFPTTRQGEAMNLINAKYSRDAGLKAYTDFNDQFAPFASQTIPATVSEAPYILDGLLRNKAGRQIREQYADTAGFTDQLFGISGMLDNRLVLRIRDLPSKRLYVFDPASTPKELRKWSAARFERICSWRTGPIFSAVLPPWSRAGSRQASCSASSPPTRARMTWLRPFGKR